MSGDSDKARIREQMKKKRQALSLKEMQSRSEIICERILRLPDFRQAELFFSYLPVRGEADLRSLFPKIWESGKRLAVPKVRGREMDFYAISDFSCLEPGSFGIPEPKEATYPVLPGGHRCLILVPGVAFSEDGKRIGYGGGFYDRYFRRIGLSEVRNTENTTRKIGIGYDFQILPEGAFQAEPQDVFMDAVLSEKNIF